MRIMLGCVCREVPNALSRFPAESVGIVASYSQVGPNAVGYSGYSAKTLVRASNMDVWRDHASARPRTALAPASAWVLVDARAGFKGVMPDWLPFSEVDSIVRNTELEFEVGHGEDSENAHDSLKAHLRMLTYSGARVTRVSTWLGTYLAGGKNSMNISIAKKATDYVRELGFVIRAHNCDWLSGAHLRTLRDLGVTEFNFAPEIGKVITDAVCETSPGLCEQISVMSRVDGRYRRWGSTPNFGGHYVLETVRDRSSLSSVIETAIVDWTQRRFDELYEDIE